MAKKIDYDLMYTLRSDGRYQGYWRELDADGEPTGKRHAICDRDPERLHAKILAKEAPTKGRTLKQAAAEWEGVYRETIAERTWRNFKPHYEQIVALYGRRLIDRITAMDVQQDLLRTKAKHSSRTVVNSRRVIWNGILTHAVAQGYIPYNPALSVKLPKGLTQGKRSAPTDDMINHIIRNAWDTDFGFIPFFLLCTGCRRSEALRSKWADLDRDNWTLRIPKSKTEAGVRTIPIIEPLRVPLMHWKNAHTGPWMFPHRDYAGGLKGSTGYMTDSNWETAWAKYCNTAGWIDKAGKPTTGAHNLRHGTATLLFEAGVDVYTAQHILGHAQVNTTMAIYTELREKQKQKGIKRFGRSMADLMAKASNKA